MSDKTSPDSRSSFGSLSTPSSKSANGDVSLVVRQQPPSYAFAGEWFDVEFGLDYTRTGQPRSGEAEFCMSLHHFKTGKAVEGARLETDPLTIWFSLRGSPPRRKQRVRCRMHTSHISKDKSDCYCISLSPKLPNPGTLLGSVAAVSTSSVTLVKHKIRVQPDEDWENIWYKDEGGRDKCMTVLATLHDRNNRLYTGEQIPLQITLYYSNDEQPVRVTKQDILRSIGSSKQYIDKKTGKCTLRFRIEDVSKNHQGQDFRVEVAPDSKLKGFKDIAPGFSPAVSIRSKRNKRHRTSVSGPRQEQRLGSPLGPRQPFPDDRGDGPFSAAEVPQLREAIKGIIQWTEEVVNGLYPLQWQVIGYHPGPDGTPDYNRPYHNMPNPNGCISRVLGLYSDSTREQLSLVAAAIERSGVQDTPLPLNVAAPPTIPRHSPDDGAFGMQSRSMQMQQSINRAAAFGSGVHPTVAAEAFREKAPDMHAINFPQPNPHGAMMRSHHSLHHGIAMPQSQPSRTGLQQRADIAALPLHPANMPQQSIRQGHQSPSLPVHGSPTRQLAEENRESEVAIVLAKQYRSLRTGDRLGFPAYTESKDLIGFYRESNMKVGVGQFVPITRHRTEFGPMEFLQATEILEEAIRKKSDSVHTLKDWGTMSNLLDHALVYEWSKDIGGSGRNSGSSSGGSAVE